MRSTSQYASRKDVKRAPPQRSSTAKAPGRRKKGGLDGSAGLRCGQEGHRPQSARPRRYARFVVERCRPSRRYPGSRRSGICFSTNAREPCSPSSNASSPMPVIKGQEWQTLPPRPAAGSWKSSTQRTTQVRRLTEALDRGADIGMDQQQPLLGARFRALCQNCRRLYPPRHDPHHAPSLDQANKLSLNRNFLDRLLGLLAGILSRGFRNALSAGFDNSRLRVLNSRPRRDSPSSLVQLCIPFGRRYS
jgi:hypothetical protein